MSKITDISALEILDSRGTPTLRVTVFAKNIKGVASVPSGASKGKFEALELRDNDPDRYFGKGVLRAKGYITKEIKEHLIGQDVTDQSLIDQMLIQLDGTPNKSRLGANAILGVSLACARCSANCQNLELYDLWKQPKASLPTPMINIINGGEHANNNLDFQEFMIFPKGFETLPRKIQAGAEVFHTLKKILQGKNMSTAVGDEGGFAPNFSSTEEALDLMMQAIEKSGYKPGEEISLALDVAATFFHKENDEYFTDKKTGATTLQSSADLIKTYKNLQRKYPIDSIEDGLAETDWEGWVEFTDALGENLQIVGDDLFVTNPEYIQKGIDMGAANAVLIKLNQIGTVSETFSAIELAHKNNYKTIISHRSGETKDTVISDLCYATGAGQIKTGSLCRSERTEKYNRLLEIATKIAC